jgi:hypothetical protein
MTFASVYPHYVAKIEKKGRTKDELYQVIEWLTGALCSSTGTFSELGKNGNWLTSKEITASLQIWYRNISFRHDNITPWEFHKNHGLSVRCIKDN